MSSSLPSTKNFLKEKQNKHSRCRKNKKTKKNINNNKAEKCRVRAEGENGGSSYDDEDDKAEA